VKTSNLTKICIVLLGMFHVMELLPSHSKNYSNISFFRKIYLTVPCNVGGRGYRDCFRNRLWHYRNLEVMIPVSKWGGHYEFFTSHVPDPKHSNPISTSNFRPLLLLLEDVF
jgi:hypothetical protein